MACLFFLHLSLAHYRVYTKTHKIICVGKKSDMWLSEVCLLIGCLTSQQHASVSVIKRNSEFITEEEEGERQKEKDSQTDRQRETDRQTYKWTDGQTDRQTDRDRERQTDRPTDEQTESDRNIEQEVTISTKAWLNYMDTASGSSYKKKREKQNKSKQKLVLANHGNLRDTMKSVFKVICLIVFFLKMEVNSTVTPLKL